MTGGELLALAERERVARDRSARREVRNPMLALPSVRVALAEMSDADRLRWRSILLAIRDDARLRADKCWKTHKPPMAAYWKAIGVICNHLARCLATPINTVEEGEGE